MGQPHWSDGPTAAARSQLESAKAAMRASMLRPIGHGPPIRGQIIDAIANPQVAAAMPADTRAALMQRLYEKYGEQARHVAPYIDGSSMGD